MAFKRLYRFERRQITIAHNSVFLKVPIKRNFAELFVDCIFNREHHLIFGEVHAQHRRIADSENHNKCIYYNKT